MGNYKPRSWNKGEKFSPVISQTAVWNLIALSIANGNFCKQGDFKNDSAKDDLPVDEKFALHPPPGSQFSFPGTL